MHYSVSKPFHFFLNSQFPKKTIMMDAKNSEWIEKTEAKIREAFDLFDKDKADAIIQVI